MERSRGATRGGDATRGVTIPLVVSAAHELKSPLALMRQLALTLEMGDCSPQEAARIARQITLTSERALRLTTDLTKATRLEESLFALEPLNPASLCEEVIEEISPLYTAKGRRITMRKRSRTLLAIANRDLLRRILLNFADNALHYSNSSEPVVITTATTKGGSAVRLGVRDYGPAIPIDIWKRLDRTLGHVPQPLHDRPESSGLGIHIANQFAAAMNAQVGATRHRDGATFYIDLSVSTQLRLL